MHLVRRGGRARHAGCSGSVRSARNPPTPGRLRAPMHPLVAANRSESALLQLAKRTRGNAAMHKTIATMLSLSLLVPVAACRRERAPMTPTPPEWLDTAVTDQVRASAPEAQAIGGIFKGTAFREGDHSQWQ